MKILVTGTAGFIGFHLVKRLTTRGDEVVGLDNINDYYNTELKYGRLQESGISRADADSGRLTQSATLSGYRFLKASLEDAPTIGRLFAGENFDAVCNLAAQAGCATA